MTITAPSVSHTGESVSPSGVITNVWTEALATTLPKSVIADLLVSGTSLVFRDNADVTSIECGGVPGSNEEHYVVQFGADLAGANKATSSYVVTPTNVYDVHSGTECDQPAPILGRVQRAAKAAGLTIMLGSKS